MHTSIDFKYHPFIGYWSQH